MFTCNQIARFRHTARHSFTCSFRDRYELSGGLQWVNYWLSLSTLLWLQVKVLGSQTLGTALGNSSMSWIESKLISTVVNRIVNDSSKHLSFCQFGWALKANIVIWPAIPHYHRLVFRHRNRTQFGDCLISLFCLTKELISMLKAFQRISSMWFCLNWLIVLRNHDPGNWLEYASCEMASLFMTLIENIW